MKHSEVAELLARVATIRNLANAAVESGRRSIENALRESQEVGEVFCGGHSLDELVLTWQRHALVFSHRILREPFIETKIRISLPDPERLHFEDQRPIGSYRLITDLASGDVEDDYLEWFADAGAPREYERD